MTEPAIHFTRFRFANQIISQGGRLPDVLEAHACWYYYLLARKLYEEIKTPIILVGDPDQKPQYRNIFLSVAKLYGVEPERVTWYWSAVDAECERLKHPKLPQNLRFKLS